MDDDDFDDPEDYDEDEGSLEGQPLYGDADNFAFLKPNVSNNTEGLIGEIKLYEARYNYVGDRQRLQLGKHQNTEVQTDRDATSALVFDRYYKRDNEIDYTILTIQSPYMKEAIRKTIKEYPGVNLKSKNIIIRNLPKCLFHYRDELQAYGLTLLSDSVEFKHIVILLRYMWEQLQAQCDSYFNLMESDIFDPGLDFANLWMAYRPGDYMFTKDQEQYRIVKLTTMEEELRGWEVSYVSIADDGSQLGFTSGSCDIERYDGYRALDQLAIFPLKYHSQKVNIESSAIVRGKKMMSLRGTHYRMYEGPTEALGTERRRTFLGQIDRFPLQTTTVKSRIMIDAATFGKFNPNNIKVIGDDESPMNQLPKFDGTEEYDLLDEHFMICDHRIPGFSLSNKTWCWFLVDNIIDVDFNTEAFGRLLLPQDQKDLIHSLVQVHTNDNLIFDDVIKGKGKGMIFLLHGVPGVGKTLTAESVADLTKRPLYTISCGELGVAPSAVEKNLKAALDLATTWNAIVLLDEADIFLEQRSMHDLDRNSLVSIFLRLLEYYEGILFLTTNRIESFDRAFKSRIHLAIKYNPLSPAYRSSLWGSFIASTSASGRQAGGATRRAYAWLTPEYLEKIGGEELNGRQIKNTVRTAHAIAVSAGVELSPKHVETALRAMRMFESDFAASHELEGEVSNKRRRIE